MTPSGLGPRVLRSIQLLRLAMSPMDGPLKLKDHVPLFSVRKFPPEEVLGSAPSKAAVSHHLPRHLGHLHFSHPNSETWIFFEELCGSGAELRGWYLQAPAFVGLYERGSNEQLGSRRRDLELGRR